MICFFFFLIGTYSTGRQTETNKSVSVLYNMILLLFYLECGLTVFNFVFLSCHFLVYIHSIPSSSSISQCVYDSRPFLVSLLVLFISHILFCLHHGERKHLHVCHVMVLIPCPECCFGIGKIKFIYFIKHSILGGCIMQCI